MKTKIIQNIKSFILVLILVLGVSYVYASQPPTQAPPSCPAGSPGCDAPLNVGTIPQTKTGPLVLGGLGIVGDFNFIPTSLTSPTTGQVLIADDSNIVINGVTVSGLTVGRVKWGTLEEAAPATLIRVISPTISSSNLNSPDQVSWCNNDYPNIIYCGVADGLGSTGIADLSLECPNNGICGGGIGGSGPTRDNLGKEFIYTEIVKKSVSGKTIFGCWIYDYYHEHKPASLDIVCTK